MGAGKRLAERLAEDVPDEMITDKGFTTYSSTDKPVVNISGAVGDSCALIGRVSRALRNAGLKDEAKSFKGIAQENKHNPEAVKNIAEIYVEFKNPFYRGEE